MKSYGKRIVGLIGLWFIFALSASAMHVFSNSSNRIGLSVAFAALVPVVLFFIWFLMSRQFRSFIESLNPRTLTLIDSWRILGFTFVLLEAHRILPAVFALPAGYGDMAIGASATAVAWKLATPRHRGGFILWQLLGIADLVIAVSLGVTAGLIDPHGVSMAPMTVLPLSLVPTFLVPFYLILHVISIHQAKAWDSASDRVKPFQAYIGHEVASGSNT